MPGNETLDHEDDIEYVSKSQLKRDSQAMQNLGRELSELSSSDLAQIPLPPEIEKAVLEARHLSNKRSALKRQIQYLGKLLRKLDDVEPIMEALKARENQSRQQIHQHHLAEQWRDRLIDDPQALQEWLQQHPQTERQPLNTLLRHCQKEKDSAQKKYYRQLYQFLKQTLEI